FTLNDGSMLPSLGLGTIGINGDQGTFEILNALNTGYRLLDTSTNYNNEGIIGEAVRRSALPREEILISAKLPGSHHEYYRAFIFLQESLRCMWLLYFDKYLFYWSIPKEVKYVEANMDLINDKK